MLLTEEEAAKRFCPMKLANAGFATHAGNDKCDVTQCMAWAPRPEKKILLVKMNADAPWEEYHWDPRASNRDIDLRDYATAQYRDIVERTGSCGLCAASGAIGPGRQQAADGEAS